MKMYRTFIKTLCFTHSFEERLKKKLYAGCYFFILKPDIVLNTNTMTILEFCKICMIYRNFKFDAISTKLL